MPTSPTLTGAMTSAGDTDNRWKIPLICVFAHETGTRNVQFMGVVAPGGLRGNQDEGSCSQSCFSTGSSNPVHIKVRTFPLLPA